MLDTSNHSLAGKAIKRPDKQCVELALVRRVEHGRERSPLVRTLTTGDDIDEFGRDRVTGRRAPPAQLVKLVIGILARRRDARIYGDSHGDSSGKASV